MHANASESVHQQVGNDIRQSLNAMQMWRAKSSTVSYSDMKQGALPLPVCVYYRT
jgi:hypothetical protein